MFVYEKKLQYPVRIRNTNPALAKFIISQYGGPDGELGASLRYLSQRYSMPYPELKGLLTDIGTEELGHLEMIGAVVHQLTRDMSVDEVKKARQNADKLSKKALWSQFIKYYYDAYDFALRKAEERKQEINNTSIH